MNNGLLFLAGLLTLVLGALFGVPYAVDWNGYRGVFEEEASKVLGRDVRVGGDVAVRFLPTPFVRFEKVRLADPTGQTGEPFLRAESFTMRLAISPLLRGEFEATDIELMKPVLSLVPDAEGGGNWASLQLKPAALPFVPQNVMLHAVRLVDGTISVHRPDGGDMTRIDHLNGELSADTLKGPFKFKGTAVVAGAARDIKFATMAPEASGTVRFKGAMHGEAGKNSYLFDGQIDDLASKPRVSGELTGKINVPPPLSGQAAAAAPLPVFELKTQVKADARGAVFEGVELALESAAEPQIVTGQASAQWSQSSRMDAALSAKWLDLDVLAAPQGELSSLAGLKQLFVNLMTGLDGGETAAVRLDVDQVKFGGERAGALHLDAERRGEAITLRRLNSGLPGGARFELAGELTRDRKGKSPEFAGEGSVRGVNFDRVKAFAQRSGIPMDIRAESPFWIAGKLTISDTRFALSRAKAEIAGLPVSGDLEITRGERPGFALRLEGDRLDSAVFFPEAASRVHAVVRKALGGASYASAPAPSDGAPEPMNASFRILAREFSHEGRVYSDVDAAASVDNGVLNIANAGFKLPAGARLSISGRVEGVEDPQRPSKGGLSYELDAASKAAIAETAQFFGLTDAIAAKSLDPLPSLQIAGLVKIGQRLPAAADVTFDGAAGSVRVAGDAGFDAGFRSWRTDPLRIVATARGTDVSAILALTGTSAAALEGLKARPGEAKIALSGLLRQGAKTYADLAADGLAASLNGTVTLTQEDVLSHVASAQLKAADGREAAALVGFAAAPGLAAASVEGAFDLTADGNVVSLSTPGLKAGASRIKGALRVTSAETGGPRRIEGDLETDRVSIAGLLSWVTAAEPKPAPATEDEHFAVWPQGDFKLTALQGVQGAIKLRAETLELADSLSANGASAELIFEPGTLQIAMLKGKAAGGTVAGEGRIDSRPGGIALSAKIGIEGDLAALNAKAEGRGSLTLEGTGIGASPAGAIAAFNGKGSVKLADARHPGPSAAYVADAADAVLTGKLASDPATLSPALTTGIEDAAIVPGSRTIPLTIANGAVKAEPYAVTDNHGITRITHTISLAELALDSTWQITATPSPLQAPVGALPDWKPVPKGPLPAVPFVYTGRLSSLDKMDVAVVVDDVSRELTVRLMERKVEELEALRNADDFRRKQELERRKALELERQQAAAAAAAAARAQAAAEKAERAAAERAAVERAAAERAAEQAKKMVPSAVAPEAGPEPDDAAATDAASSATGAIEQGEAATAMPGDALDGEASPPPAPGRAAQPARVSVPKAQPRPPRRSTTSDEVNRAFGGWP